MTIRMTSYVRVAIATAIALVPVFGAGAYAEMKTVEVVIEHFAFVPPSIEAAPGDTVVFINRDIAPHTATAVNGSWTTNDIAGGNSEKLVIPANGAGVYFCRYHLAMKGRLVISDAH